MIIVFDLDDTLYDEIDFVRSGFAEVAGFLQLPESEGFMWEYFNSYGSGRVFNVLIEQYGLDISLQKLIEVYRFHWPRITLDEESKKLLNYAKNFEISLISDGHYIMQMNKFNTLGLEDWIKYPIFSDYLHTNKNEEKPFQVVMGHFGVKERYIYVADNPLKDFAIPKALGWRTLRFRNPRGIYRDISNTAELEVESRKELLEVIQEWCS